MRSQLLIMMVFLSHFGYSQNAAESIVKGNKLYQQSQFDLAEAQYRKALEYEPDNEKAKYNLAAALHKQSKYSEAAKLLDDLAGSSKDKPLKSAAYYNQGVGYTKLHDLDSSIESYKNALRFNPDDKEARENLEKALLQKKNQSSSSQSKSQSSMSQKQAQQKLDMLNQKEKQLHQKKDRQQQGSGQAQDW